MRLKISGVFMIVQEEWVNIIISIVAGWISIENQTK